MTLKPHSGPSVTGPGISTRFAGIAITRRSLLAGTAFAVASTLWRSSAVAQATTAAAPNAFLRISQSITGKSDLSATTSDRIHAAFQKDDVSFNDKVTQLGLIGDRTSTPDAFKTAAAEAGLGDTLMAIVAAWYTGTVDTSEGAVVVAYTEALMYKPVADGLTVPTYCNKGPMWWTGLPPEITRMPENNPKVL
jgi:hypothetical protein